MQQTQRTRENRKCFLSGCHNAGLVLFFLWLLAGMQMATGMPPNIPIISHSFSGDVDSMNLTAQKALLTHDLSSGPPDIKSTFTEGNNLTNDSALQILLGNMLQFKQQQDSGYAKSNNPTQDHSEGLQPPAKINGHVEDESPSFPEKKPCASDVFQPQCDVSALDVPNTSPDEGSTPESPPVMESESEQDFQSNGYVETVFDEQVQSAILSSLTDQMPWLKYQQLPLMPLLEHYRKLTFDCACSGFTTTIPPQEMQEFHSLFHATCKLHHEYVLFHGTLKKWVRSFITEGIKAEGEGPMGKGFFLSFNPLHAIRHAIGKAFNPDWHWSNINSHSIYKGETNDVILGRRSLQEAHDATFFYKSPEERDGDMPVLLKIRVKTPTRLPYVGSYQHSSGRGFCRNNKGFSEKKSYQLLDQLQIIQDQSNYKARFFSSIIVPNTNQSHNMLTTDKIEDILSITAKYLFKAPLLKRLEVVGIIEIK